MPANYHLVVVGAHALDAELMAGGLIARAKALDLPVTIVHLTRGERGHPTKSQEVFAVQLEEEMERAANILGARQMWLGFPAGSLDPKDSAQVEKLFSTLLELKPTHLITHWRGSWHPRHVQAHDLLRRAAKRFIGENQGLEGLYYGENCEDLDGFRPGLYVELSAEMASTWFQAVAEYELFRLSCDPQTETIPYDKYYRAAIKVRGLEAGVAYAQAFMAEKKIYKLHHGQGAVPL